MRFNHNLDVDIGKWTQIKMERENNRQERIPGEEMPKFGAGSEYRRDEKEEARRKKFGFTARRYNPDSQPWILKIGGKNGKKYRGVREGGVNENAGYYVFMHGPNNTIEAYPAAEWYNFSATQRFKALSAEEAEHEFGKRNNSIANITNMMRKRFNKDDEDVEEDVKRGKTGKNKEFKISDMDDWVDSDDDDSDGFEDVDNDDDNKTKKSKKNNKRSEKTRKVVNDDESALEESDDGDEEGRELDYISDSSEIVSDDEAKVGKEMKSVAEEGGLRKLLTSDEEEEDGEEKEKDEKVKNEPDEKLKEESTNEQKKSKKRKMTPSPNKIKNEGDSSSDVGAESTDSEANKIDQNPGSDVQNGSNNYKVPIKKPCLDASTSDGSISEEAVRRYLARKPMTATELLQKFKKPRTNLNSEQLVTVMTQILKKINPHKQTIKDKLYLSLKPDSS